MGVASLYLSYDSGHIGRKLYTLTSEYLLALKTTNLYNFIGYIVVKDPIISFLDTNSEVNYVKYKNKTDLFFEWCRELLYIHALSA